MLLCLAIMKLFNFGDINCCNILFDLEFSSKIYKVVRNIYLLTYEHFFFFLIYNKFYRYDRCFSLFSNKVHMHPI